MRREDGSSISSAQRRELALDEAAELRRVGQLLEAAPVRALALRRSLSVLAMTRAAILRRRDAVLFPEPGAECGAVSRRRPGHVGDLVERTQMRRRDCGGSRGTSPCSAAAPGRPRPSCRRGRGTRRSRRRASRARCGRSTRSRAGRARGSSARASRSRSSRAPARASGSSGQIAGVAVHARLGRRDRGMRRFLDRGVAVAAVDAQLAGVQRVAVRHRLLGLVADVGRARRSTVVQQHDGIHGCDGRQTARDRAQRVDPFREDERTFPVFLHREGAPS